jgi:phospholipase C
LAQRRLVSSFTPGGHMSDEYTDHLSILKFIEAKWRLPMISDRSGDNLRNLVQLV